MTTPAFAIDVNGVRATSARFVFVRIGVWFCDVDLDPDSSPVTSADVPTGKATITITPNTQGATPIIAVGTFDPLADGRFVSTVRVRVVGGGNGWNHLAPGQHFHSDVGLSSATVEAAIAGVVGETVNDPSPISLGLDWVHLAGPARRVFADRDWYVDLSGVTQVGSWPSVQADPSLELLTWDPLQQRGEVAVDALVLPGTQLSDPRFDGTITVVDVEHVFDAQGSRATVWCSANDVTRLITACTVMVRELGKLAPMRIYEYRIQTQSGAKLNLQAVTNPDGSPSAAPDLVEVVVWPGMAGLSAEHNLGSNVLVAFIATPDGNQAPFVFSFDPTKLPLSVTLDASGEVQIGPTAATVSLAGGGPPIARVGDTVLIYFPPILPFSAVTETGIAMTGTITIPGPGLGSIQTGSSKANSGFVVAELLAVLGVLAFVALTLYAIARSR
jgi:hypothetical protein